MQSRLWLATIFSIFIPYKKDASPLSGELCHSDECSDDVTPLGLLYPYALYLHFVATVTDGETPSQADNGGDAVVTQRDAVVTVQRRGRRRYTATPINES